jgi:pSer/pThr/pTyr-binding forkhead associated (FHA) protein
LYIYLTYAYFNKKYLKSKGKVHKKCKFFNKFTKYLTRIDLKSEIYKEFAFQSKFWYFYWVNKNRRYSACRDENMGQSIRLIVKRGDQTVNRYKFDSTPIYIGRKADLQVVLPDMAVSREHTMIDFKEGKWTVEDLESANKTYLNSEIIRKAPLKSGDVIKITGFSIGIDFVESADASDKGQTASTSDDTVSLDDTQTAAAAQTDDTEETEETEKKAAATGVAEAASLSTPRDEVIVRKPDAAHAPAMRLAARRLSDFAQAVEILGDTKDLDTMVRVLLDVTIKQFTAFRVWCGLRSQKTGPITFQAGKRRDGKPVQLSEIKMSPKIIETFERGQSIVLPQVSAKLEQTERIRSAMIASIKTPKGCFGVIYVDNSMVHNHFSLSDLDYLMVLAMHTAAVLKSHL